MGPMGSLKPGSSIWCHCWWVTTSLPLGGTPQKGGPTQLLAPGTARNCPLQPLGDHSRKLLTSVLRKYFIFIFHSIPFLTWGFGVPLQEINFWPCQGTFLATILVLASPERPWPLTVLLSDLEWVGCPLPPPVSALHVPALSTLSHPGRHVRGSRDCHPRPALLGVLRQL